MPSNLVRTLRLALVGLAAVGSLSTAGPSAAAVPAGEHVRPAPHHNVDWGPLDLRHRARMSTCGDMYL